MTGKTTIITDLKTKVLLACGVIACPLFIIAVLIEGATRPDYDSFLYPLSSLSIGTMGWTQISNFIFNGILLVIFSYGLRHGFNLNGIKFRGSLLIGLTGIGLMGAGIFVTDPVFGYPTNKPLVLKQFTFHGHLHDAFSMLVFICLPWVCFVSRKFFVRKSEPNWANYSVFTGFAMIATFIIASMGFQQVVGLVNFAGLFQRLCIFIGLTWVALLSVHLLKGQVCSDN